MLDDTAAEALTRSLTLGVARNKMPIAAAFGGMIAAEAPKSELTALALLGQRQRFRRPAAWAGGAPAAPIFVDTRPIVPAPARPLLIALLSGKAGDAADPIARAIAEALARAGRKLHPFDLPALDKFVSAEAELLGPDAIAWAERRATPEAGPTGRYFFAETIDETNWTEARPAQKAAFIRSLRARDPERARGLVEAGFAVEPAPVRAALLAALAVRLSASDRPFLDSIAKDRAPSVRDTAAALIARLPGTEAAASRLRDVLSRVRASKTGLLRRRAVLELDYPATVKPEQRETWAAAAFAGVALDDLASGLGLAVDALVSAAAADPVLTTVLALLASAERRNDLLGHLTANGAAHAWERMVWAEDFDPPDVAAWSLSALRPDLWSGMPQNAATLGRLHERIRTALPPRIIELLLSAPAWRELITRAGQDSATQAARPEIAALCALAPPSLRQRVRDALAALPASLTARAFTALTLLDLIEAA